MSNSININGIEISATAMTVNCGMSIAVDLTMSRDGKTIKTCSSLDAARFVRPESLSMVLALVDATRAAHAATEAHIAEVARYADVDAVCDHQDRMDRIMAVQG